MDIEVDAPASGVLRKILVPAGETVPINTPIAVIAAAGRGHQRPAGRHAAVRPRTRRRRRRRDARPPGLRAAGAVPGAGRRAVPAGGRPSGPTPGGPPPGGRAGLGSPARSGSGPRWPGAQPGPPRQLSTGGLAGPAGPGAAVTRADVRGVSPPLLTAVPPAAPGPGWPPRRTRPRSSAGPPVRFRQWPRASGAVPAAAAAPGPRPATAAGPAPSSADAAGPLAPGHRSAHGRERVYRPPRDVDDRGRRHRAGAPAPGAPRSRPAPGRRRDHLHGLVRRHGRPGACTPPLLNAPAGRRRHRPGTRCPRGHRRGAGRRSARAGHPPRGRPASAPSPGAGRRWCRGPGRHAVARRRGTAAPLPSPIWAPYEIDGFTPIINPPQTAILGWGASWRNPRCTGARCRAVHDGAQPVL